MARSLSSDAWSSHPKGDPFQLAAKTSPRGGPRRRWRDLVKKDQKAAGIQEDSWHEEALHRGKWCEVYNAGLSDYQQTQQQRGMGMPREVKCDVCGRCFRRECDKARHKCMVERRRPVHEQVGAVRCTVCGRWLRSRGGLAAHRCGRQHENATSQADNPCPGQEVVCGECGRWFSRPGDSKRHKCAMERAKPVEEQTGAV